MDFIVKLFLSPVAFKLTVMDSGNMLDFIIGLVFFTVLMVFLSFALRHLDNQNGRKNDYSVEEINSRGQHIMRVNTESQAYKDLEEYLDIMSVLDLEFPGADVVSNVSSKTDSYGLKLYRTLLKPDRERLNIRKRLFLWIMVLWVTVDVVYIFNFLLFNL